MSQSSNPFNDFVFLNARPAERGSFTLALDKALDKLEKFQLPDPSFFLLQWIQALVASGSQSIHVALENQSARGHWELRLVFDGPGYSARELQSLYDHVFLSGRDRNQDRLRELSLGWLSASSLGPTRLLLESNGWRRAREGGKNKTQEQVQPVAGAEVAAFHRLEIAGQGGYKFEEMLTSRCLDVPVPLIFNGRQLNDPTSSTGVPWPNRSFENGPTRGVMGATYGTDSASQITFLRYGVHFVNRTEPALKPPVIVRASDPTLSKNVSQTDVVRDEAYEEFLARLRSEMKTMGLALTAKRIPSYQRDALNRYLQAYIGSHLDIRALEDPERLERLGPDYANLLHFPVFCSARGVYRSLAELHTIAKRQGALVYCLNPQARTAAWDGVLLVVEPQELEVLRKFFPNLIPLTLTQVQAQIRGGNAAQGLTPEGLVLARLDLSQRRAYTVSIPDSFPTGLAVLQPPSSRFGTVLTGLQLTLHVVYLDASPPNQNEIAWLEQNVLKGLDVLKRQLLDLLVGDAASAEARLARPRAAELLCEILNLELERARHLKATADPLEGYRDAPLIGLEDGQRVSLNDVSTYLQLVKGPLYLGGAFVEGLESGALDPMPEAERLLRAVYPAHSFLPTERRRSDLLKDQELRFSLRRQTLLVGLAKHADPRQALARFASEAAEEAAELARIEQDYRQAIDRSELFVAPDQERLLQISSLVEDDLDPVPSLANATPAPSAATTDPNPVSPPPAALPSLESDLRFAQSREPDLFPERSVVHVELWEPEFSYHLTNGPTPGRLMILHGQEANLRAVSYPVRGFIRLASSDLAVEPILEAACEQMLVKANHASLEGPEQLPRRRALRQWLLEICAQHPARLRLAAQRQRDLYDLPLVPCLGGKTLSWRTLHEQARRFQETVVWSGPPQVPLCPSREVILLQAPLTLELLQELEFPPARSYQPQTQKADFELLYRSTRRDLASVLSGQTTPLLQPNLVEQMASDSSFWKRWRAGFLSWDSAQSVVVINPQHKIGKTLVKKFAEDPSWSGVLACALFSAINRGLEEVQDEHERAFLESLIESLE